MSQSDDKVEKLAQPHRQNSIDRARSTRGEMSQLKGDIRRESRTELRIVTTQIDASMKSTTSDDVAQTLNQIARSFEEMTFIFCVVT